MSLSVGIVGLPNVGKSTLFNALLKKQQALAANYPFATIEPNTGIVEVPDERLDKLAEVISRHSPDSKLPPIKRATIEFVDIAGLVAGASKGEGLGNQFLANIRETDLICHVMRAFEDGDVVVTGQMNPLEDLSTIRTELAIKDIESLEKQDKAIRQLRDTTITETRDKALQLLSDGKMIFSASWSEKELDWLKTLHLLTAKPEIFVINVSESDLTSQDNNKLQNEYASSINTEPENIVIVSAKIEAEVSELPLEDQSMFLEELGLTESGIERMAATAYTRLHLMSYLTAGEKEVRAWTVSVGAKAPQAAGVIHTDFEKKFIKADVINYKDFVECSGWKNAREQGKVRLEGKDYVIQDGDVVDFKIGS